MALSLLISVAFLANFVSADTTPILSRCVLGSRESWTVNVLSNTTTSTIVTFSLANNLCLTQNLGVAEASPCDNSTAQQWQIKTQLPPFCTFYPNSDIAHGENIKTLDGMTPDTCCTACQGTPSCKAFTLSKDQCFLHPANSPITGSSSYSSGICNNISFTQSLVNMATNNQCLSLADNQGSLGSGLTVTDCTTSSSQSFSYAGGYLKADVGNKYCISAGLSPAAMCDNDYINSTWCDHTKPLEERVDAIVANLTLDEKAGLLVNSANGVSRIGWPKYDWWSEALHGVARDGVATSWPQVCGVGSSYNKTLWNALATLTSTEARGKSQGQGKTYWAPNINIFRDPRWGRGQETPSEDPTVNGDYAEQFVKGMQGSNPTFLKVSACLKHYAAYSEETGRGSFPAFVTAQDMADSFLPAFQAGVQRGNASGMMCSYNAETYGYGLYGNGTQGGAIPSCANKYLMNDLARESWGFYGYITSDCGATKGVQGEHHYTNMSAQTFNATLEAGMDIDCGSFMNHDDVVQAVSSGQTPMTLIDNALHNLFRTQFRLGMVDPPELDPYSSLGSDVVNTPAHQQLAKEAAAQGFVLLKNTKNTLPLDPSKVKKVAVIGRNANASTTMQGNYQGTAPFLITPLQGFGNMSQTVYNDGTDINSAIKAASQADAVILVVGLNQSDEKEGKDRTSLVMPDNQDALIVAVAKAAADKPVIVMVMSGGPVDISNSSRDNDDVDAIIWVGYPGQAGGQAMAEAVFGVTNSFGKLSMTWYPASFTALIPIENMHMRPNTTSGNPGRTHRFYTGDPVFKFGEGLSYTTFSHTLDVSTAQVSRATVLEHLKQHAARPHQMPAVATATIKVTNTGLQAGDHVCLLFGKDATNAGTQGYALQELLGFDRIFVPAGATTTVSIPITAQHLSHVDDSGRRTIADQGLTLMVEGVEATIALV
eukprot:m.265888 g.265888  ORF g.265888 m.265888 type:complete len:938 (+) comp17625_c0_seq69:4151-6964(+)